MMRWKWRKIGWMSLAMLVAVIGLAYGAGAPLATLLAGNARFVAGTPACTPVTAVYRQTLARGQHPSAVVITCSDSRVAPEVVLDKSLGEIFVVRTAGNVLDDVGMGSVEYAVEHLHTPLILVLGHQHCGAVMAALGRNEEGGTQAVHEADDHIGSVLALLAPAVKTARAAHVASEGERLEVAIQANVHNVVRQLQRDPALRRELETKMLTIEGAEYSLESGKVMLLP